MSVAGINFTSASAELAAMMVEHEANQAEIDHEQMDAYQRQIEREAEKEYRAAMAAADAGSRAALLGGAMGILGSGAAVAGAAQGFSADTANEQKLASHITALGTPFNALKEGVQWYGGGREKERQQARAHQSARTIEQMRSEADQLAQQARRSEQRSDAALDHAAKFVEGDSARANAVLSNF
jgi:hypothetical protein